MMKNKRVLNLRNRDGFKLLETWAYEQIADTGQTAAFHWSPELSIGYGAMNPVLRQIAVGIDPLSQSRFEKYHPMDDLTFVKLGVSTFHETAHFKRSVSPDTPKEILLSELSKYQNKQYYKANWNQFPFEIDAEYTGVMTMWTHLKDLSPEHADPLMLEHLTYRADRTLYMMKNQKNGLGPSEHVEFLFENSYDRSLNGKRNLPLDFLRFDDEVPKTFTIERGVLDQRYEPFYRQLMTAATGEELDLKISSLVSYLHPEEQIRYPTLDFTSLHPERIFGIPMPETREEIKDRIGMRPESHLFSESITCSTDPSEISFSESVAYLTDLMKADAAEMSDLEASFSEAIAHITNLNEQQMKGEIL